MKSYYNTNTASQQASDRLQPRKDLGQNFLRDPNIARNIVRSMDIAETDTVLEIGPGEGALTALLLDSPAKHIVAVEYDARAVKLLEKRFATAVAAGRLRIIHSDILALSLETIVDAAQASNGEVLKIVGNIPYYITSDILFWVFNEWAKQELRNEAVGGLLLTKTVIMMQKEVAQRIAAKPRTKEYGILSVASLLVSAPKLLFHVSPQCFFPPPKVTSSVVEFSMKRGAAAANTFRAVHPFVRVAFNQRRKVLSNALSSLLPKERLPEILTAAETRKISYFRSRAEELLPEDFVRLHEFIREFQ